MSEDLNAGTGCNGDFLVNLKYVIRELEYPDMKEAVLKYCYNTTRSYLLRYRVNEADLCRLLAHAPNQEAARELEAWIVRYNLKRPLRRRARHANRAELERRVDESSPGYYVQYQLEEGEWVPEVVPRYRPRGWWETPAPRTADKELRHEWGVGK